MIWIIESYIWKIISYHIILISLLLDPVASDRWMIDNDLLICCFFFPGSWHNSFYFLNGLGLVCVVMESYKPVSNPCSRRTLRRGKNMNDPWVKFCGFYPWMTMEMAMMNWSQQLRLQSPFFVWAPGSCSSRRIKCGWARTPHSDPWWTWSRPGIHQWYEQCPSAFRCYKIPGMQSLVLYTCWIVAGHWICGPC